MELKPECAVLVGHICRASVGRPFTLFERPEVTRMTMDPKTVIKDWPDESREAAQLVIDRYGDPDESTPTLLTWHEAGPWKRVIASRTFYQHDLPAPHIDAVESVIDYRVPVDKFTSRRVRRQRRGRTNSG